MKSLYKLQYDLYTIVHSPQNLVFYSNKHYSTCMVLKPFELERETLNEDIYTNREPLRSDL